MVLSEISPRRARCSNWFLEYLRAHCHVLVLPDSSSWPAIQEILVVEEIHDLDPAGKYLHQTTHRRFLPNAIPTLTVFSSLRQVQFFLMLSYQLMILAMDCKVPRALTYFFIANTIIFIYLFGNFYRKSYTKKQV